MDKSAPIEQNQRTTRETLDPRAVREQLDRVLESPPFRNSKRYPAMLRYVVEHAIEGNTRDLKERTVAVEVFSRSPGYDPAIDPVVRVSAAEVRRRLAQYYQEPAHADQLRIELPVGSYVPEFQPAAARHPTLTNNHVAVERRWQPTVWLLLLVVAAVTALATGWNHWRARPSELDQFWAPVVAPGKSVLVCVATAGVPARGEDAGGHRGRIAWPDTLTLARLTGFLQGRASSVQFCREDLATFADFQSMPAVLIGGLNDEWALRLMQTMRFQFQRDGNLHWIADRDHPESRAWKIELIDTPDGGRVPLKRDYAVVSRALSRRTGKITITVAGLSGVGTLAAGRFLTDPVYFHEAAKKLPADWRNRNLQLVLGAEVIEDTPGPPEVLASFVW